MSHPKTQAIVPAAGQGTRLGVSFNKPLVLLNGKPLLVYSLLQFEKCSLIDSVILVSSKDNLTRFKALVKKYRLKKVKKIIEGGQERFQSVACGLKALDADTEYVLIHDGARPLISLKVIEDSVHLCFAKKAVTVAVPVKPTIKKVDPKNFTVQETLMRDTLWEVQTPQVFESNLIIRAHQKNECCRITDDAAMVEALGVPVKILRGDYRNIKITTADDLVCAKALLK